MMKPSLMRVFPITLLPLLLLISCGGPPAREGVTPAQAHMFAHFDRAGEVHHALVRGDLPRAKRAATWIATHHEPGGFPEGSSEYQGLMEASATRISQSYYLKEAAEAAAQMGQACGDCHRANGINPRFLIGTAPPSGTGPQAEMARHVWASERMWEGLVGPGDHAWSSGAEALKSGWLDPQEVVSNPGDRTRIRELVMRVYELGAEAESTEDSAARAALYGEFLNTCTECHELTAARIR